MAAASFQGNTLITPADSIFKTQTLRTFLYHQETDLFGADSGVEPSTFLKPRLPDDRLREVGSNEWRPKAQLPGRVPADALLRSSASSISMPGTSPRPVANSGASENAYMVAVPPRSPLPFHSDDLGSDQRKLEAEQLLRASTRAAIVGQLHRQDRMQRRMRPSRPPSIQVSVPVSVQLEQLPAQTQQVAAQACARSRGSSISSTRSSSVSTPTGKDGSWDSSVKRLCSKERPGVLGLASFSEQPEDSRVRLPAHRIGDSPEQGVSGDVSPDKARPEIHSSPGALSSQALSQALSSHALAHSRKPRGDGMTWLGFPSSSSGSEPAKTQQHGAWPHPRRGPLHNAQGQNCNTGVSSCHAWPLQRQPLRMSKSAPTLHLKTAMQKYTGTTGAQRATDAPGGSFVAITLGTTSRAANAPRAKRSVKFSDEAMDWKPYILDEAWSHASHMYI